MERTFNVKPIYNYGDKIYTIIYKDGKWIVENISKINTIRFSWVYKDNGECQCIEYNCFSTSSAKFIWYPEERCFKTLQEAKEACNKKNDWYKDMEIICGVN